MGERWLMISRGSELKGIMEERCGITIRDGAGGYRDKKSDMDSKTDSRVGSCRNWIRVVASRHRRRRHADRCLPYFPFPMISLPFFPGNARIGHSRT